MSCPLVRRFSVFIIAAVVSCGSVTLLSQSTTDASATTNGGNDKAQVAPAAKSSSTDKNSPDYDKRNNAVSEKQRKQREKDFKKEVSAVYRKWLDEDVVYIITPEERAAFKQLSNDEERDNFIEAFWARRDPTPDTAENEFKEEHYARIAYAN